jgi:hypothetical protein
MDMVRRQAFFMEQQRTIEPAKGFKQRNSMIKAKLGQLNKQQYTRPGTRQKGKGGISDSTREGFLKWAWSYANVAILECVFAKTCCPHVGKSLHIADTA